jgi:hypothetical protein
VYKTLLSVFILLSFYTSANETNVLTVDRTVTHHLELAFPNEKNLKAKDSDFELINYVLMSNDLGERWAVITLNNTSTGNRVLEHEHLMALFADGKRNNPPAFKVNFEGHETQSVTVSFGESKFPILSINSAITQQ